MTEIARLGDKCTGHDSYPPRPSISASSNVFVNGVPVLRVGDSFAVHCDNNGNCHGGQVAAGSSSVFANGSPVARIGDPVSCGSSIASGSGDIIGG